MKIKQAWIVCCIALLSFITTGCAATSQSTNANLTRLPVLNWQEHSDWINVKTDVIPKAIGDGKADDTKAIQAAIDKVASSNERGGTVYLPPGTYRITQTLKFIGPHVGAKMIGSGRDTRIIWDGEKDDKMLITNSLSGLVYRGIVLDGRNKAAFGVWSYNTKAFITGALFRDAGFINLTDTGIYCVPQGGWEKPTPTRDYYANAETLYQNCLFRDVKRGFFSQSFNDYDHTFSGCEFDNCEIGIQFGHGNFYIRDTHFEGGGTNILCSQAEHPCSIRRVTSVGAERFLDFGSIVAAVTVQDCHVKNWSDTSGAMSIHTPAMLLFNNTFQNSDVAGPVLEMWQGNASRITFNNKFSGLTKKFFANKPNRLYEIPGKTAYSTGLTASQIFLTDKVAIPGKVFNAKKKFGAKGDGKTDDTAAIQNAINAARQYGKGAIAYLPQGKYLISKTLNVTGANYYVGGESAFGSALVWTGKKGGTMMHITAPQNITIQNISIGHTDSDPKSTSKANILQTGSGKPSSIHYNRVYVYGRYQDTPIRACIYVIWERMKR